jgi:lipopolysaccharide/colanic/teichoic acid biosynthesis glycosyltransferase
MDVWLFVASLVVSWSLARSVAGRLGHRMPAWGYRASVLAGVSVVAIRPVSATGAVVSCLIALCGGLVGGVAATSEATGFVEDNAPVTQGVREKILAHHAAAALTYPEPPRFKRAFDVAASTAMFITLPLWTFIACAIWIDEPGPIFFTKNSVGKGGIVFRQVKFRSMTYDAERLTGHVASIPGDPRALRVGVGLRRWHLDELPELINVLTGTMTLVGPRPLRAVLVQRYLEDVPDFVQRHTVRPGIACIAQIEKYHISPVERLRKDRVYIRRMSMKLDLMLLRRAVTTTVVGGRHEI